MTTDVKEIEVQFAAAVAEQGYGEHTIPADGRWHNIGFPSDNGKKKGSAKLTIGKRIEGAVKDFREGDKPIWTWKPGKRVKLSEKERKARATAADKEAAKDKIDQEEVRLRELNLFASAPNATPDHLYLKTKGIKNPEPLKLDGDKLLVPIYNARTAEFQTVQRITPKGEKRFPKHGVKAGGCAMPGSRALDELQVKRPGPIVIAEGFATAAAVRHATLFPTLAAIDCGNLKGVAEAIRARFPLRAIIIAADNDADNPDNPGLTAATAAARAIGAKLAIPPPGDFNDLFVAKGEEAVAEIIKAAAAPAADTAPRPSIKVKAGELSKVADRGEKVLRDAGVPIYQRSGDLVRTVVETVDAAHGRHTKVAQLKSINPVYMRDLLGRVADWEKSDARKKNGWRPVDPPHEVASTILARVGEWGFPSIAGVISTPTLRPDGSLLDQPGYDAATRLLLVEPPPMPPIPAEPTKDDAAKALALLESLLTEFPFVDDVARTVALSAIITPVVRGAFPVAPMHAVRAPVAGSGKSFLLDTVSAIAIGQLMPVMAAGANEEETEKRIGAAMRVAQPLVSIDNVNGELGGDALCQIIERPVVDIRILGLSEKVRIEARGTTFFANGNNLILINDICRRAIISTLDPKVERPELIVYKGSPVATVLADRGKFIAAALTICRAYVVAGRPNRAKPLASFEGWSDTLRSALIWLDRADPVNSMEVARDEDPKLSALREILTAWAEVFGVGYEHRHALRDVITKAEETDATASGVRVLRWPSLASAIKRVAGGFLNADVFGKWARGVKGRFVDGLRLANEPTKGAAKWWIESLDGKSAAGKIGKAVVDEKF